MEPIGFNPATINQATTGNYVLGQILEATGSDGLRRLYRFVKVVDAAVTDGDVLEWASTTSYSVTADRAGGSSLGRMPAGVAVGGISQNQYGFILVFGLHSTVGDAANGCTAGRKLTTHATTDGDAANVVNAYDIPFGDCIDATSATTCIVAVRCL